MKYFNWFLVVISLTLGMAMLITAIKNSGLSFTVGTVLGALLIVNGSVRLWLNRIKAGPKR